MPTEFSRKQLPVTGMRLYRKLLHNVEMQEVFEKAEMTMWECRNCGHLVMGKKAPAACPVCAHPQSFFEVRKENY